MGENYRMQTVGFVAALLALGLVAYLVAAVWFPASPAGVGLGPAPTLMPTAPLYVPSAPTVAAAEPQITNSGDGDVTIINNTTITYNDVDVHGCIALICPPRVP